MCSGHRDQWRCRPRTFRIPPPPPPPLPPIHPPTPTHHPTPTHPPHTPTLPPNNVPSLPGIEKHGGRVLLRSHVEEVVVEDGRATGVQLRSKNSGARPEVIRAGKAVISNASVWDTARLLPEGGLGRGRQGHMQHMQWQAPLGGIQCRLPDHAACESILTAVTPPSQFQPASCLLSWPGAVPEAWRSEGMATPRTGSFMHLHLGIDAAGLRDDLEIHHLVVNQWQDIEVCVEAADALPVPLCRAWSAPCAAEGLCVVDLEIHHLVVEVNQWRSDYKVGRQAMARRMQR